MDKETFTQFELQVLRALGEIRDNLAILAATSGGPDYRRRLDEFQGFDWSEIGALVIQSDDYGPALVKWAGQIWTRRSGGGKFGRSIWFSRPVAGGGPEGSTRYLSLIRFKNYAEAEPVSGDVIPAGSKSKNGGDLSRSQGRDTRPAPELAEPVNWFNDPAEFVELLHGQKGKGDPIELIARGRPFWGRDGERVRRVSGKIRGSSKYNQNAWIASLLAYEDRYNELLQDGIPITEAHETAVIKAQSHYRNWLSQEGVK